MLIKEIRSNPRSSLIPILTAIFSSLLILTLGNLIKFDYSAFISQIFAVFLLACAIFLILRYSYTSHEYSIAKNKVTITRLTKHKNVCLTNFSYNNVLFTCNKIDAKHIKPKAKRTINACSTLNGSFKTGYYIYYQTEEKQVERCLFEPTQEFLNAFSKTHCIKNG